MAISITCPYCNSEDLTMVIESSIIEDNTTRNAWKLKLHAVRCHGCERIFEIEKRWRKIDKST